MTQLCKKNFIPISCHSRKSLPSSTRWRRRMVTSHLDAENILLFSSLRASKTIGSYSIMHNYRTDFWGFYCEKFLTNMEWKLRFHQNAHLETWLTLWYPQKPSALWLKLLLTQQKPDPIGNCSIIFNNPKKACFTNKEKVTTSPKETWVAPSTGETRAGFVSLVPNQRVRRSRPLFMLIQDVEVIWQCLFPKLSQPCYVTSIKTNESLMDRDIVKLLNPYCWESLNEMESKISMTKCGYKRSLKAAQRKGLSSVKTTIDFLSFTSDSRGILEVFQSNQKGWVM